MSTVKDEDIQDHESLPQQQQQQQQDAAPTVETMTTSTPTPTPTPAADDDQVVVVLPPFDTEAPSNHLNECYLFNRLDCSHCSVLAIQVMKRNFKLYQCFMFMAVVAAIPALFVSTYLKHIPFLVITAHIIYPLVLFFVRGCLFRCVAEEFANPFTSRRSLFKKSCKVTTRVYLGLLGARLISWCLLLGCVVTIMLLFTITDSWVPGTFGIFFFTFLVIYHIPTFVLAGPIIAIEEQGILMSFVRASHLANERRSFIIGSLFELCLFCATALFCVIFIAILLQFNGFGLFLVFSIVGVLFIPSFNILKTLLYLKICREQEGLTHTVLVARLRGVHIAPGDDATVKSEEDRNDEEHQHEL